MITNSFCFLERVGLRTEQRVWDQGISCWNDFINAKKMHGFSEKRRFYYNNRLNDAKKALLNQDSAYFTGLPSTETWRLYDWFSDDAAYLDIETGFANTNDNSSITIISLHDGVETKTFVKGINLYRNRLQAELGKYKLIITFNGASFDLPVIKKHFSLAPGVPHLDLRFACYRAGFSGGLKQVERELGISRDAGVEDGGGSDAAFLWKMWKSTRKRKYLDMLVKYNEEDSANLEPIAKRVIGMLKSDLQSKINANQKRSANQRMFTAKM